MAIDGIAGPALSGLQTAQTRLGVSANNVANQRSVAAESLDGPSRDATGSRLFQPQRVVGESLPGGGVRAQVQPVDPPSVQRFRPEAADADAEGLVNRPNIDLVGERVAQIAAQRAFEANLRNVEAADELAGGLLDITE